MKRQFHVVRRPDLEGSPRSHALAAALAEKCDPEFLERILELKCLFDSIGGQVYTAAYRTKYDTRTGEPVKDVKNEPGRYETDGYVFHYEHIAKINRQAPEPDAKIEDTPDNLEAELNAEAIAELVAEEAVEEPVEEPEGEE